MTLTLYVANKRYSSWSMRPWVLLKSLNIPFKEERVWFQSGHSQPQFKQISPTGRVPSLLDTETNVTIWESLAICEYIAENYPAAWPEDKAARAFARSAASEMHAGFTELRNKCPMVVGLRIDIGSAEVLLQRDLDRLTQLFEEGLKKFGGPWLAGKTFTIADAFFAPVASRLKTYTLTLGGEAQSYIDRLFEHDAVKTWIEEGIHESERDPSHEEEATVGRTVLQDLTK